MTDEKKYVFITFHDGTDVYCIAEDVRINDNGVLVIKSNEKLIRMVPLNLAKRIEIINGEDEFKKYLKREKGKPFEECIRMSLDKFLDELKRLELLEIIPNEE